MGFVSFKKILPIQEVSPVLFKTIEQAKEFILDNEIEMVDFKMTDIDGRWRHITIPATRFNENTMKYGIGFDGSNYGYAPVENSDMVFIPDLSTAAVDPFAEVPTLTMSGDAMIIDPRTARSISIPATLSSALLNTCVNPALPTK